jgi:hypothetical protein
MHSSDIAVNASLTLAKIRNTLRRMSPDYKPSSYYQMRLKNKRAARRAKRGMVR